MIGKLLIASTIWQRTSGLLFRPRLQTGEALWIHPCQAIHTFGMRYPIGVFFLDQDKKVILALARLNPLRIAWCVGADSVVETLPVEAGLLAQSVQSVEALLSASPLAFVPEPDASKTER